MKKILSFAIIVLGMLSACDPSTDDLKAPSSSVDADDLLAGFSYVQYSDETYTTEQADGNYFAFTTSPSRIVKIYQLSDDGTESVLSSGSAAGTFKLSPKRGGDSDQTIYIKSLNYDATEIVASTTVTVYVPTELTTDVRLLASDAYGSKVWKWDVDWRDGAVWGNAGYSAGSGDDGWASGIWWGATPEELLDQLQHSDTGVATGEESVDATMVFDDEGGIVCYDAGGNQIRSGKYSVSGYTGERNIASVDGVVSEWALGYLNTDEGSILFPFQINSGTGYKPTQFEIMNLDAGHLRLVYAAEDTGNWSECTWWAFKSNSDAEASLTNFDTKDWTWDVDWRDDGGAWGNAGYSAGGGDGGWSSGIWWACAPADLTGQLGHSDTGVATGEEDPDAYMTFDWNANTVTSYDASGNQIRKGNFEISTWDSGNYTTASVDGVVEDYAQGYLTTDEGSILFPFMINSGGYKPTEFAIVKLTSDQLQLVYAPDDTGNWSECTWWAFKAK